MKLTLCEDNCNMNLLNGLFQLLNGEIDTIKD